MNLPKNWAEFKYLDYDDQGRVAFLCGATSESNPYSRSTDAAVEWLWGWMSESYQRTKSIDNLKRLIANHVEAQIALSWKGGGDPRDWPAIEEQAKEAEENLNQFLGESNASE